MAKSKQPVSPPEETLEELLDQVENAREALIAIERKLERLRGEITKTQKQDSGAGKKAIPAR